MESNEFIFKTLETLSHELSQESQTLLNNVQSIILKSSLSDYDLQIISAFTNSYFSFQKFINNISFNNLSDDINEKINICKNRYNTLIDCCYAKPASVAKNTILDNLNRLFEQDLYNASNAKSKSKTLVRKNKSSVYYDYDQDIENDFGKISGFANNILLITTVIILGIIIAIIVV